AQGLDQAAVRRVVAGLAIASRHRRPLARRRLQPQVAIGGHALAMLDHGHAGLVTVRIDVGEHGDVEPRRLEIALLVELQARRRLSLEREYRRDSQPDPALVVHCLSPESRPARAASPGDEGSGNEQGKPAAACHPHLNIISIMRNHVCSQNWPAMSLPAANLSPKFGELRPHALRRGLAFVLACLAKQQPVVPASPAAACNCRMLMYGTSTPD